MVHRGLVGRGGRFAEVGLASVSVAGVSPRGAEKVEGT
jgi:hypothetical protein